MTICMTIPSLDLHKGTDFFMLSKRQLLTIKHLKDHQQITEPDGIIEYCLQQLAKPFRIKNFERHLKTGDPRLPKSKTRKRGKKYYQDIVEYCIVLKKNTK